LNGYSNAMSVTHTTTRFGPVATVIVLIADIAAVIIGLWILMYLLEANRENVLVEFVQDSSRWLAGWSRDLFTFDKEWLRVVSGYGLAALVYLCIGNVLAARLRRF
jgi:hypothetical protein